MELAWRVFAVMLILVARVQFLARVIDFLCLYFLLRLFQSPVHSSLFCVCFQILILFQAWKLLVQKQNLCYYCTYVRTNVFCKSYSSVEIFENLKNSHL